MRDQRQALGPFTIADDPANVILIATEDGWADTIRPRLEVADADLSLLFVFSESSDGTGVPTFPADMEKLVATGIPPTLVVVDTWIDTVAGGLQVKDTQKARQAVVRGRHQRRDSSRRTYESQQTRGSSEHLRSVGSSPPGGP